MEKNSTRPTYDPKLPNDEWLKKQAGHSNVPVNPAKNPGTTSPSPQEVKQGHKSAESRKDDEIAESGEVALTTQGEEMRPKDGNLDGGTAR